MPWSWGYYFWHYNELELCRAHTPRAHLSICLLTTFTYYNIIIMLGCAHEQKARGGAVDRRGQQNPSVCDARGPYQTIRSIMKQVFWWIRCAYVSIRCLNLEIWRFCVWVHDGYSTPCCACARGVERISLSLHVHTYVHALACARRITCMIRGVQT
jgi:hypothetical protein